MADPLYAHTTEDGPEHWQTLHDHSENVAQLAAGFASDFGMEAWAYPLGLLHDMGKASDAFQRRLRGSQTSVDHSTAGAQYVSDHYGDMGAGLFFAPLIAGHHGGIPNWSSSGSLTSLMKRLEKQTETYDAFLSDVDVPDKIDISPMRNLSYKTSGQDERLFSLYVMERLLFSCFVDADWLDTERVMSPNDAALRPQQQPSLEELDARLSDYVTNLETGSIQSPVNEARHQVLTQCEQMAELPPGLFTLEVPTGGGKTLASMQFALRHALHNGQRRIIYAIPFTSIVEQTAAVYKEVFGHKAVLEHHSNYDFSAADGDISSDAHFSYEQSLRERLQVQNWDAPIVVTTNVQLFESLFANKASKSRKVHNIANSVIVLDEVQTLPDSLLKPTLAMLEALSHIAHVSIVLCTATQPALDELWPFGSRPTPIINNYDELLEQFGTRTTFTTERVGDKAYELEELVEELTDQQSALCIVSSRRAARILYDALLERRGDAEGLYHLSTLMVPAHRSAILEEIRERLNDGLPCTVISTQLIEAGVDVDFPVVYRELAGIDSVLQAAGRCNREGKLAEPGIVNVFDCNELKSTTKHPNWLFKMKTIAGETLNWAERNNVDPFGQESVKHFFDERH